MFRYQLRTLLPFLSLLKAGYVIWESSELREERVQRQVQGRAFPSSAPNRRKEIFWGKSPLPLD